MHETGTGEAKGSEGEWVTFPRRSRAGSAAYQGRRLGFGAGAGAQGVYFPVYEKQ